MKPLALVFKKLCQKFDTNNTINDLTSIIYMLNYSTDYVFIIIHLRVVLILLSFYGGTPPWIALSSRGCAVLATLGAAGWRGTIVGKVPCPGAQRCSAGSDAVGIRIADPLDHKFRHATTCATPPHGALQS